MTVLRRYRPSRSLKIESAKCRFVPRRVIAIGLLGERYGYLVRTRTTYERTLAVYQVLDSGSLLALFSAQFNQPGTLIFLCVIEDCDGKENHQYQYNVGSQAYTEIDNASNIACKGSAPHKRQDVHDKHPADRVGDVP